MNKLMQLSSVMGSTVATTRELEGMVATFGAIATNGVRLPDVTRRQRRENRRRRLVH